MRIALFQPDIPQNTGTILRLCACLDVEAHIIEPAGFPVSDRHFRRAGMDYLDQVTIVRHDSWATFEAMARRRRRPAGSVYDQRRHALSGSYAIADDDILLFGRESAGVPDDVVGGRRRRLVIPIRPGHALAERRHGGGDGAGRGAAADRSAYATEGSSVSYAVKEIFLTLQGEGAHAGRAAVFCRFAGCNLWTGREQDRADARSASSATPISSAPTARWADATRRPTPRRHHRRAMDRPAPTTAMPC